MTTPLQNALARIDALHAEDPDRTLVDGVPVASELLYAQRMTEWLDRLRPDAGEILRLAVRAQHLQRWRIPRADFPADRIGYLQWRTTLARLHADLAADAAREAGYGEADQAHLRALLRKERIKSDPDAQTLEDCACLVFLQYQLADFAPLHDDEKLIAILRKTWKKMSPAAHAAAGQLSFPPAIQTLLQRALAP